MEWEALARETMVSVMEMVRLVRGRISENVQGQKFVLNMLRAGGGSASPGELAEVCCVSSARMSVVLDGLERQGAITRSASETDRRRTVVSLTESGRRQTEAEERELVEKVRLLLEALGENDAREFSRIMKRVCEIEREESKSNA